MHSNLCPSCFPPLNHDRFISCDLGMDINGIHGRVSIEKCKNCSRLWLLYYVHKEWRPNESKWIRGVILKNEALEITPEAALLYLQKLEFIILRTGTQHAKVKFGSGKEIITQYLK